MYSNYWVEVKTKAICPTNEYAVFKSYSIFYKKNRDLPRACTHALNVHGQPQYDT